MGLEWLGKYQELIGKLMKFGNAYAQNFNVARDYDGGVSLSASEVQTMECILQNEDKNLNMAETAARIGLSPSTFSKNVHRMEARGLLEKYHASNNKKDIIIRVSDHGREVYAAYCRYACQALFERIFSILDEIPPEYIDRFAQVLDISAGATYKTEPPTLIRISDGREAPASR